MYKVWRIIRRLQQRIVTSIAFYPSLISFVMFLLALFLINGDVVYLNNWIREFLPSLAIRDANTAFTLLGSIIGGLMTLLVFSFSMVMVLVNQAASMYSPRLLPGFISDKRYQIVLGTYTGTVLFSMIVLLSFDSSKSDYQLPTMAILISVVFSILSIGLFVFFIHTISNEIRIDFIINRLRQEALSDLKKFQTVDAPVQPDFVTAGKIKCVKDGYIDSIDINRLQSLASTRDLKIRILYAPGKFITSQEVIIEISQIPEEDIVTEILNSIQIFEYDSSEDQFEKKLQYLTEIAVKAMSPGINDPATAIQAIESLYFVFSIRLQQADVVYFTDDNNIMRIVQHRYSFASLLNHVFQSLRLYCKSDTTLMCKMIHILTALSVKPSYNEKYVSNLWDEIQLILMDAKSVISNKEDLRKVQDIALRK